jgi:hypothetical protein
MVDYFQSFHDNIKPITKKLENVMASNESEKEDEKKKENIPGIIACVTFASAIVALIIWGAVAIFTPDPSFNQYNVVEKSKYPEVSDFSTVNVFLDNKKSVVNYSLTIDPDTYHSLSFDPTKSFLKCQSRFKYQAYSLSFFEKKPDSSPLHSDSASDEEKVAYLDNTVCPEGKFRTTLTVDVEYSSIPEQLVFSK